MPNLFGLSKKRIYLDYASITPIDPRVMREMKKFSAPKYANPSSWYKEGVAAKKALDMSRKKVADFLHALPDEIVFTSGGTEANGLALEGARRAAINAGIEKPHLIVSSIEHSSIIEVAKIMEKQGCEVTRLGVDKDGQVDLDELKASIRLNTFMVSIMTVNNEIGTIQPIREIAKIVRQARKSIRNEEAGSKKDEDSITRSYPLFHTDAAQAAIYSELYVEKLGIDLLTLDGSKVYGPRGIGALYIKRNTPIEPIIYGGGQESGMRSGTENLPGIAGFAKAIEIAQLNDSTIQNSQIGNLRAMMIAGLRSIRPDIKVNGPEEITGHGHDADAVRVSPHILNVSIPGTDNEFFVMQMDANGVACSTKSSCLRDESESYVLRAIGAKSGESVRFSFGRWTKKREIKKTLKVIAKILSI